MEQFRNHPYWCPRGHPEGVRRLDVFSDYGAFPVWGKGTLPASKDRPARELYGALTPELLDISARLSRDLRAWAEWRDLHNELGPAGPVGDEAWRAHHEWGRELANRLAAETGAVVVYGAILRRDAPPDCPHCGRPARRDIG